MSVSVTEPLGGIDVVVGAGRGGTETEITGRGGGGGVGADPMNVPGGMTGRGEGVAHGNATTAGRTGAGVWHEDCMTSTMILFSLLSVGGEVEAAVVD